MFRPETPGAPDKSNKNPPHRAPTDPHAISSRKPLPCLSTILLPINPAISPSMIQLIMPISVLLLREEQLTNTHDGGFGGSAVTRSLGGVANIRGTLPIPCASGGL